MTSHGAQEAEGAAWNEARADEVPTVGWFVRRSALWMGIMVVALVMACTLYAVASQGASEIRGAPEEPLTELKV